MIKISYICDTCGTVHSHTFYNWCEAEEYCSKQDRRQGSTSETTRMPTLEWNHDTTTRGANDDSTNS